VYEAKLQPVHIKYIMYQVMLGMQYLHNSKLIHRDLKPSNILVNSDCSAKICDFGLVRFLGSDVVSYNTLTEGVATRWYRAPEVLLGSNDYNTQADMWSLGCILAEIMIKNPLFPGTCTTNQLERILQLTGHPSAADIKSIKAELGEVMIAEVGNGKIRRKADILSKI
jgi:mitogen-activated protein kinase 15